MFGALALALALVAIATWATATNILCQTVESSVQAETTFRVRRP